MKLRALILLFTLGAPTLANAAAHWAHLCRGRVTFQKRCCGHRGGVQREAKAERPQAETVTTLPQQSCCKEISVSNGPMAPATEAARSPSWEGGTVHLAPPSSRPPWELPVASTVAWAQAFNGPSATAPPLYLQHCSYLI